MATHPGDDLAAVARGPQVRPEFTVHRLNGEGMARAEIIAMAFSDLLGTLEMLCGPVGREMAVVRTKLEEASFFAKKAMASRRENQQPPDEA